MKTINFECEIITPMFLMGADGKTPEIRPPSIKGLIRFWWRAMGGDLSSEANIFGGSEEKIGKSKVTIVINNQSKKTVADSLWSEIPYIEKTSSKSGKKYKVPTKHTGLSYLLYSVLMLNERPYIKDKQKFNLELKSKDSDALKNAIASFWSLVYLGGIGTRARRGAGNIIITKITDKDKILESTDLDFILNTKEIAEWIIKNYQIASSIINKDKNTDFISEYSNLSISRFIISSKGFKDWKEALNDIGIKFSNFRKKNKGDIFETAAFGLPRKHIKTNKEDFNRRSSPLIFKILKSDNKYYWMVLRLAGEFLPENIVLKANNESQKPSYSKIDEFWNLIKKDNSEHILYMPDTLKNLKSKIIKELSPSKIILFGSKARGDFHKDSDTDIAVETEKNISLSNIIGSIDLVDLKNIDEEFKKAIEREGIEI